MSNSRQKRNFDLLDDLRYARIGNARLSYPQMEHGRYTK
jgi:hypothetical protein